MIKVYILVVLTHVYSGKTVSFQEFNSLKQCQANADYLNTRLHVNRAYCTEK